MFKTITTPPDSFKNVRKKKLSNRSTKHNKKKQINYETRILYIESSNAKNEEKPLKA